MHRRTCHSVTITINIIVSLGGALDSLSSVLFRLRPASPGFSTAVPSTG